MLYICALIIPINKRRYHLVQVLLQEVSFCCNRYYSLCSISMHSAVCYRGRHCPCAEGYSLWLTDIRVQAQHILEWSKLSVSEWCRCFCFVSYIYLLILSCLLWMKYLFNKPLNLHSGSCCIMHPFHSHLVHHGMNVSPWSALFFLCIENLGLLQTLAIEYKLLNWNWRNVCFQIWKAIV